jgi:Hemerythrin HHE cation binding domain
MRGIIENLRRQHKDLTRVTMEIVPRLEPAELVADATPVRRSLKVLNGILKVHLAMEDQSFYPYLLSHRDHELRHMAEKFLDARDQIEGRFRAYVTRWLEAGAIEKDASGFVAATRQILMDLGTRMVQEDREFHPLVLKRAEVA